MSLERKQCVKRYEWNVGASGTTIKYGVPIRYTGIHMNQNLWTCGIHSHNQQFAILLLLIYRNYIMASANFFACEAVLW